MSDRQHKAIENWLKNLEPNQPKFIASSSALLPRHRCADGDFIDALRSDGWDGYPHSFHRLLSFLVENEIKNVVFLSGDEHISSVTHAELSDKSGKSTVIHSVHNSGLYSPLPFSNSVEEDLLGDDCFKFNNDCSGLMTPDTLMRDNISQTLRWDYGSKACIQAIHQGV